jgi:hypothetical protein
VTLCAIPIHANELIDNLTTGEATPGCGLMIHKPTIPISEFHRKHHTAASITAHVFTSFG